jgi:hypothetical protein
MGVKTMPTEEQLLKLEIIGASMVSIAAAIVVLSTFQLLKYNTQGSCEVGKKDNNQELNNSALYEIRRNISNTLTFAALVAFIGESLGALLANIRLNQLHEKRESGETNDPIGPSLKISVGGYLMALGSALIFQGATESEEESPERIVVL